MSEPDPIPTPDDPAGGPRGVDRGISPIGGSPARARTGRILTFTALLAGCAAFAAASWLPRAPRPAPEPDQPARQVVAFEPVRAAAAPTLTQPGPGAPALGDEALVPSLDGRAGVADTAPSGAAPPRPPPLLAYSRGRPIAPDLPGFAASPAGAAPETSTALTELEALHRGPVVRRVQARPLGDRTFLLLAGASIPCILQTAMDSSTPGYVTGVIPTDVWSDNGAVVLLEKGTRVLGEYRSGLRQGQRRLFVLWTRAVTPSGVAIDLASPAADALGRSGFDGAVDTRFWDRFGGALLLSIVDDGTHAIVGDDGRSATARVPSDAAGVALQGSIGIGPVLRKPQGAEVTILAAQDFDFSAVYGLRSRAP